MASNTADQTGIGLENKFKEGLQILDTLEAIVTKYAHSGVNAVWSNRIAAVRKQGTTYPKVMIGVVGSTGAGKSSVINAIMEEECLVPTSSMKACTAAITEISYADGPDKYGGRNSIRFSRPVENRDETDFGRPR
ncbi:hypothetical protein FQN57_007153 [Myotisia sp. PD_48]|nr:hypothetical protein FQN57_007153 [Myotisia sp. PD_48]